MKTLGLIASTLALAAAVPQAPDPEPPVYYKFKLISHAPYSAADQSYFNMALSNVYLNLPQNNALCPRGNPSSYATFVMIGTGLYLYSTRNPIQQVWVDRSVSGEGKMGYLTQDHWIPPGAEFDGWSVDANGYITFDNGAFIACPNSADSTWSVWFDAGVAQPGGNQGCVPLTARREIVDVPISCTYTVNATLWEIE